MAGYGGGGFSFIEDIVSMTWARDRVSSWESLSEGDIVGGWKRRGGKSFVRGPE